ncbi:hypothetical protein ADK86_21595 [Streptomyces sp. NRRL F-5755]|uniref:DUF6192 family protein n=1 Tax=Streptomyces sp. NRRL F-5755 TaxID=1519475 RepID=UPI0006C6A021|nr:DUF6192 family protein [Streptomyces sp. NRRL F-5755]KOT91828.1 hypothetical protein ADK86_21595 [Streptomyces sp. NRRL F-5755]
MPEADRIGQVSRERYEQTIAADRKAVASMGGGAFSIGDHALEIEPMRPHGGSVALDQDEISVRESLRIHANDIGLTLSTIRTYRYTAFRFPPEHRRAGVSFKVHAILAVIADDAERYAAIADPPWDESAGCCRWTTDSAKKRVGRRPEKPETVGQKVDAIHDLAVDDEVAAKVASDVLRRPAVAAKVMADDSGPAHRQ